MKLRGLWGIFLIIFLFINPKITLGDSKFQQYKLKYGLSIQIPNHWLIVEKRIMDQIDTNTELITGIPQGNNEILIAANYYGKNPKIASATVRVSLRHTTTIDQEQLSVMSEEDIKFENYYGKLALEDALKKMGHENSVSDHNTTRKIISNLYCLETIYLLNNTNKTMLYIFPMSNKNIKLHITYLLSEKHYLEKTISKIISSLIINRDLN